MKIIGKNLGIASIISVYLMSCAPNRAIYKTLHSENDSDKKIESALTKTQNTQKTIDYTLESKINKRIEKYYSDPKLVKKFISQK